MGDDDSDSESYYSDVVLAEGKSTISCRAACAFATLSFIGLVSSVALAASAAQPFQTAQARTTAPIAQVLPELLPECPCTCNQPPNVYYAGAMLDPSACLAGDKCSFGVGWCRKVGHELAGVKGTCQKGECLGPKGMSYVPTENTCGKPGVATVDYRKAFHGVPKALEDLVKKREYINDRIAEAIWRAGIPDLLVELDEDLVQHFQIAADSAKAAWMVGCYPPERHVMLNGEARLPRGHVHITAAGLKLIVEFHDFVLGFTDLRVEVACNNGGITLAGVGSGGEGSSVDPKSLHVLFGSRATITCERRNGWKLLPFSCRVFGSTWLPRQDLQDKALAIFPGLVAHWLGGAYEQPLPMACPAVMHNTMSLMRYSSKACCEANFAEDANGCVVGGQFNGVTPGAARKVENASCKPAVGHTPQLPLFEARCETLPGGYYELSPGVCREGVLPTGTGPPQQGVCACEPWDNLRWALAVEPWVELLLLLSLCCCLLACLASLSGCCRSSCGSTSARETRGDHEAALRANVE